MSEKNNRKNFWIGMSLPIAIFIGYGIYMIFSYSTGRNDNFKRRYGMQLDEKQMMEALMPRGDVMNAMEAIAVVREKTDVLDTIEKRVSINKNEKDYGWVAVALKDAQMKNWQVTIREKEVKPKQVCTATVITFDSSVKDYKCYISPK
ncbi:MAG: hypothetical protein N4A33_13235 [Bacteriovoracaceae bacterium]|jgi:hypothetical protein|nr:hypothetical protein [Bacteriovoracaceae bacterium]